MTAWRSLCRVRWRKWWAESRSEEHTSELQSHVNLVCRLLLEKKKKKKRAREGLDRSQLENHRPDHCSRVAQLVDQRRRRGAVRIRASYADRSLRVDDGCRAD